MHVSKLKQKLVQKIYLLELVHFIIGPDKLAVCVAGRIVNLI